MHVYVIRHADAGDPTTWPGDDADRPLSELGRAQAGRLGEAFRERGFPLDVVVSSPLVRTRETAEGVLNGWEPAPPIQFSDLLAPGALRRRKLSKHLAALGVESVAVVGHDPDLPAYLGWLIGADPRNVKLEKGAAALVRCDGSPARGEGRLVWVVTSGWYLNAAT